MREIDPAQTRRAAAFQLWMSAPMPMVTMFKTLDVTPLVRWSKKYHCKFNMMMCWCIGKAASQVEEFFLLPVGDKLIEYDRLAVNTVVAAKDGEISQRTEELVGPYQLHDFFLYYTVRWGFPPAKVLRLAERAFAGSYERRTILRWLGSFYRRFFAQQFKRSCMPDGPKVGSVSLSPRGDWRMPSDASARLWLEELEGLS